MNAKLKPGDRVMLNYATMTPGTAQYWRGLVGTEVGTVAHTNPSRNTVHVEWGNESGWFQPDALTAETVQPGLWV